MAGRQPKSGKRPAPPGIGQVLFPEECTPKWRQSLGFVFNSRQRDLRRPILGGRCNPFRVDAGSNWYATLPGVAPLFLITGGRKPVGELRHSFPHKLRQEKQRANPRLDDLNPVGIRNRTPETFSLIGLPVGIRETCIAERDLTCVVAGS